MSYAAAAFILEKSNKMLLMFKALKRKPNANTATTTQCDTSMSSSLSQSKQTSAVNSMENSLNLTRVLQSNDNNNRNEITATNLVTQQSPTDSNDFAILHFLFNDINSLHNANAHNQSNVINTYVNEPFTSNATTQMEVIDKYTNKQSFYEIDSNDQNVRSQMAPPQQTRQLNELAGMPSIQSNDSVVNTRKLFDKKQKSMINYDGTSSNAAIKCGQTINVNEKSSFKKRLKFKFKTGFQFFKDTKVRCRTAFRE